VDGPIVLKIIRNQIEQSADLARQSSSSSARERTLVSQSVALAIRDHLKDFAGIETEDSRSASVKYTDILDVCDFRAHRWSVEVRVITNVSRVALYVPTMPLMVGVLSDFYICAQVDSSLSQATLFGYATREQLSQAELSANSLFATLPLEDLKPFNELPAELRRERPDDIEHARGYEEWRARADRIIHSVNDILAMEGIFSQEQVERVAAGVADDILRIYGERIPGTGLESLFEQLFRRFGIERPVPSSPRSDIAFINRSEDRKRFGDSSERAGFFHDNLNVRERVSLYRHLLEDKPSLEEHRELNRLLDIATEGRHNSSPRRKERIQKSRQSRARAAETEPPVRNEDSQKTETRSIAQVSGLEVDTQMLATQLKPNVIVHGPIFPEPVQVIVAQPVGDAVKLIGKGMNTGQVHDLILSPQQLATLIFSPDKESFDGDPFRFRLGIEALRLSLAYEYDPYFSLSIARVDPLPHQLEAVYDYFMKLPRIRFLLADDPGAGKTIMAGLLLKELKIRGLIRRTLIITPANLCFQWQRELKDKFRENFEIIRGDVLRANYGSNPWQEKNQVITSVSWVSVIEDAKESLLRSHWDLIIVDEAHKMSAYSSDKKTLAYQLGESLSQMTDHFLLMTATPHKGDPKNFCLFLELLDRDVYGDIKSLEEAMRRNSAPFYLRRTKEALITFPDPDTGQSRKLFTDRNVDTIGFQIDSEELEFYDALTRYVEDQSIKASVDDSARGRALAFTMAMLQRRFASSIYAVRRSLQRMLEKRQRILDDPTAYRQEQIARRIPPDFDELPEDEQQDIITSLENVVGSIDPASLREEIRQLGDLVAQAMMLEKREVESKLVRLREEIVKQGVFKDPNLKLLIFTEHKDTLDYLVGKLREWGLTVTQIHGQMKIGDRDTPGTRIYAEREFRDNCQVLVATEAAGEGINLQFCWFMINYDIPWNPMRLEQRMGRIHRYGQEKDCLIFNFVSMNTREGRVLTNLLERLKEIRKELGTDHVFDVVGEIFPSNRLEKMFREMYSRNLTEAAITARIIEEVDADRFRRITGSALEGLAKRELNLSSLIGKSTEARERRLVPEVVEDFFIKAAPLAGIHPREVRSGSHTYRVGRIPRTLWPTGERLEPKFGRLGREYKQVVFDKSILSKDATSEWVTPGHPLFESVREDISAQTRQHLQRGSIFFDLHTDKPYRLDVFTASIKDGRGNQLHRKLFAVEVAADGSMSIKQPTIFLDLSPAPAGTSVPEDDNLPDRDAAERALIEKALNPYLAEIAAERERESKTILEHIEISLSALIHRQNLRFAELIEQQQSGDTSPTIAANLKQTEDRIEDLNHRLERRREELAQERHCAIGDIQFIGRAWVLPHPDRSNPQIAPIVRDEEIERIAVQAVINYEEARGWVVESVESENRGFDLISRKPHPEDPSTSADSRFIEVKGRSTVGEIALSSNEYKTAERLKEDYWLYVVFNCATNPEVHIIRDPARLGWKPVVKVEHYQISPNVIYKAES